MFQVLDRQTTALLGSGEMEATAAGLLVGHGNGIVRYIVESCVKWEKRLLTPKVINVYLEQDLA